jgi:hypothetical protein
MQPFSVEARARERACHSAVTASIGRWARDKKRPAVQRDAMALDASPRTGRDTANRSAAGSPLTDYSLLTSYVVLESELVGTKRRV